MANIFIGIFVAVGMTISIIIGCLIHSYCYDDIDD